MEYLPGGHMNYGHAATSLGSAHLLAAYRQGPRRCCLRREKDRKRHGSLGGFRLVQALQQPAPEARGLALDLDATSGSCTG